MPEPTINPTRLWSDLITLASIGALPHGGCDRLALTDADAASRRLFAHWCREAGLPVTIDAIGNMFARREGTDPALPPVLIGSHLDTQQPGGKFDGPLGVLAALECVRALDRAAVRTRHPVVVVNWTNEEGARFAPGLMGAAVHAGSLPLAEAHAATDRAGRRVGEELRRIGFLGRDKGPLAAHCYLELHIEQGDRLQHAGKTIGVVEGTENNLFLVIDCWGENAHAQATPMRQRRSALLAAAALITEAERIGQGHAPAGSAGIAAIDVLPNNRINIPHHVRLSFSATHPTNEGIEAIRTAIAAAATRVAEQTGTRIELEPAPVRRAIDFDPALGDAVEQAAADLGYGTMRLRSRAGHDAIRMAPFCRSQMIFVPCEDGISHSERENMAEGDAAAGAAVLLRVLCQMAG
ncbi:MAG: Zn-dependent hydrolase [Janthinobacterium lividum]